MKLRHLIFALVVVVTVYGSSLAVTIDPGQYNGRYFLSGTQLSGLQTVNLSPGTYTIDNGANIGGSAFSFTVDGSGNVSTSGPSATASGSTLTFNNATISINPDQYKGRYFLSSHGTLVTFTGQVNEVVIPGLAYTLDDGANAGTATASSSFAFTVIDGSGNIMVSGPSATASGNTLRFNNVTIIIDPVKYTGRYFLSSYGTAKTFNGTASETVIPGLLYSLDSGANVGTSFGSSNFLFAVDDIGRVSTTSAAAQGVLGNTLQFNNVTITVNAATYTGRYYLSSHEPSSFTGNQAIVEVPGLVYGIDNGSHVGNSNFLFLLTASGQITNITDSAAATATGSILTLTPIIVGVSPGTYTGTYRFGSYEGLSGFSSLAVLPNLVTSISIPFPGQASSVIPTSASVTPSTVAFTVNGQTYVFTFLHSIQDVLNLLASEVQAFLTAGGISPSAAATISSAIQNATPFLTSNPALATMILNGLITTINNLTALGQISPAVRNLLVPQIMFLIALLP